MVNRTQLLVGVSAAGVAAVIGVFLWRKWSSSSRRKVAEVTQLYVYPIKSCHRIELKESDCNKRGLQYDRCWAVVREKEGQLLVLSQTQYPKLAAVQPQLQPTSDGKMELHITAPDMSPIIVPEELPPSASTAIVSDTLSTGECQDVGDSAAQWFSKYLGIECRLCYMAPSNKPRYFTENSLFGPLGMPGEQTSFANTSSLLVVTENALDDLNSRMQTEPIPMNRFRPNVVVRLPEHGPAHGRDYPEDSWTVFIVGSTKLRVQRPCTRCFVTTVDQDQGVAKGYEPLKTLRTYRMYSGDTKLLQGYPNGLFGLCCAVTEEGTIAIGDGVYI